ncbi:hypothetical protein FRX31_014920 [Thalictrum thalictroides]|uniref:Uncharacterized protein n=1 Tax=Thalictrum thalictroides TaxID=46969 RepID=A0A7J6WHE4_THATH|nr:hypothetical protein FRX31_014920 [Thalictrum thalictroides]
MLKWKNMRRRLARLSLKLESLRLEKEEMNVKQVERIDQKWPSNHMGSSPQKRTKELGATIYCTAAYTTVVPTCHVFYVFVF